MNTSSLIRGAMAMLAIASATAAPAADDAFRSVSVHGSYGNDAINVGIHARLPLTPVAVLAGSPLAFVDGGLALWQSTHGAATDDSLADLSAVVGLRWRPSDACYVDLSVGPHILSRTRIDDRRFGINLQFGSRLAAGFAFGDDRRHEIGAYVEHISNARLARPNKGMTFYGAEYRYAFR